MKSARYFIMAPLLYIQEDKMALLDENIVKQLKGFFDKITVDI